MSKKILIVDDNEMNRAILCGALGEEYDILEATNGEEAITVLFRHHKMLSAVLLDLVMPVMDGFEVLRRMRANPSLAQIPVIVATAASDSNIEVRALSLGANDFVIKPYNPDIIRHRLRNTINLRETASTVNALQRDKLTGLYNRDGFFDKAEALLREHPPGYYIMAAIDIDNFKIINDQYGAAAGDRLLKQVGKIIERDMNCVDAICSRVSADNFAALYPADMIKKGRDFLTEIRSIKIAPTVKHSAIPFSVGRCHVTDLTLPVNAIYDRAFVAKQSVKGRYDEHLAYFDESMMEKLIREQRIVSEMDAALAAGQFEVWLQPQFDHVSGTLAGAEALVRWRHPERGLIPPGEFIPVFERNGFIYKMDKYVWEQTCILLRKWLDAGLEPLPVSVNISRYDLFRESLVDVISSLVRKYDIPARLLRLEITESAFAKSTAKVISVVKSLVSGGFTIEIDDFGSGYSSLNTLKDVPAQIVKLDMRFLESGDNSKCGGSILESVVRMTKWLGMDVIAEGVEERAQADFLKSIGCTCLQGYFYARPMPVPEYEAIAAGDTRRPRPEPVKTVSYLDSNNFWDPKSMDTLIFNSFVGGACIFEYHGGRIEILRTTDKYIQMLGAVGVNMDALYRLNWIDYMDEEGARALEAALEDSLKTGEEATGEYVFYNLPGCAPKTYLQSSLRVIAFSGDRYLVYCLCQNTTAQRLAEEALRASARRMKNLLEKVSGKDAGETLSLEDLADPSERADAQP